MENKLFNNKYRINSSRAEWHDYNCGTYFITMCVHDNQCLFGEIIEETMILNNLGQIAHDYLYSIPSHYKNIEVPLFVVMPNHIHALIIINDNDPGNINISRIHSNINPKMQLIAQKRGLLSECIGQYKAAVSRYANKNNITFKWQCRFHDYIIRDQSVCNHIADYIENNPAKWAIDKFYIK